nr:DNA (cytosine-5-)-methyltransferase [Candidatus Cyanaurora vandensis]
MEQRTPLRFIDLFCGLGGFRIAAQIACQERDMNPQWVFASDIDVDAQAIYQANFGERPAGDITQVNESEIPDHDILLAGFPCQAFSICGDRRGFADVRGTLFFDIARILTVKRPPAFILENVKQLRTHDKGRTLGRIVEILANLGYQVEWRILNALNFGLPQKRERIFIVGFRDTCPYRWPEGGLPMRPLLELLEPEVDNFYYASAKIRQNRLQSVTSRFAYEELTLWHENKSGNIGIHPYSCAMRAGASYNYLLVNGKRRLTEREMLRLQGFPDEYCIKGGYSAMRKLVGNSVAIPCVSAVAGAVLDALRGRSIPTRIPQPLVSEQSLQSTIPFRTPSVISLGAVSSQYAE